MSIKDALGNDIQVDDYVIYNLSGELAYGQIISAEYREEKVTWGTGILNVYKIRIRCLKHSGTYNAPRNGISTVKNPFSIIVVKGLLDGVSSIP